MTQAGIDFAKLQSQRGEFRLVQYTPEKRSIKCEINETLTLKLKQIKNGINVMIKNASKFVTLTIDEFKFICDSEVGIQFLSSVLNTQAK